MATFALIALTDVGRPSLQVGGRHHSLRLGPGLYNSGKERSSSHARILLSAFDCGCDWLLQGPAALISL